MTANTSHLLTLNGGSSSIKFAVFTSADAPQRLVSGQIERIGYDDARLHVHDHQADHHDEQAVTAADHAQAMEQLLALLDEWSDGAMITAVGHRVVHGGERFTEPVQIDQTVIDELHRLAPLAPEHVPHEVALIELVAQHLPEASQVACFDTAFHAGMPSVARTIPLPRELTEKHAIRRYGFHGISYAYLLAELQCEAPEAASGRVIFAHLGNGASMAAVKDGRCIDTTMSFTPTAGLIMSTRSGDLDPGVLWHLMKEEGLSADEIYALCNRESGLRGVSGTSADMRDLLAAEAADPRAAEAVDLFCYRLKRWIGSFAAALGGLDALVFSGGIGEHAAPVRERACAGLGCLDIQIDPAQNAAHASVISAPDSAVTVRVMHTDEELMIARAVQSLTM